MENINDISKKVSKRLFEKGLVPVEISARHIHLSREDADRLFGKNYKFKIKKELSQPGEYLYEERVNLKSTKGIIKNVAILGPCRKETQVELSLTDSISLGINAPVKLSGHLDNAESIEVMVGDNTIKAKTIIAKRHIHMKEEDAKRLNLKNGDIVNVKMLTERPLTFEDTVVRIDKEFSFSMHIDFDEANACALKAKGFGIIIKSEDEK